MRSLIDKYFLNNNHVVVIRQLMAESAAKQE
jgi:Zn-dependent M16 (insulinase) family peptidase